MKILTISLTLLVLFNFCKKETVCSETEIKLNNGNCIYNNCQSIDCKHGNCETNNTNGKIKCYCSFGYAGKNCDKKTALYWISSKTSTIYISNSKHRADLRTLAIFKLKINKVDKAYIKRIFLKIHGKKQSFSNYQVYINDQEAFSKVYAEPTDDIDDQILEVFNHPQYSLKKTLNTNKTYELTIRAIVKGKTNDKIKITIKSIKLLSHLNSNYELKRTYKVSQKKIKTDIVYTIIK